MDHHDGTDQPEHDRLDLTREELVESILMGLRLDQEERNAETRDALLNDPDFRAYAKEGVERMGGEFAMYLSWFDLTMDDLK